MTAKSEPGEAAGQERQRRISRSVLDDENVSVKRLAWAFGCAKKDSVEEVELYRRLRVHFAQLFATERAP